MPKPCEWFICNRSFISFLPLIRKRSSSVKTQKEKTISFWHQHGVLLCLKRKCKGNTIAASLIKPELFWMIEKTPGLHTKRLAASITSQCQLKSYSFHDFCSKQKTPLLCLLKKKQYINRLTVLVWIFFFLLVYFSHKTKKDSIVWCPWGSAERAVKSTLVLALTQNNLYTLH